LRHDDLGDGVNYPPVLLVHGTDDQVVPFALQSAAYDVMQSRSIMVETVACDGLGHGIDSDGLSAAIAVSGKISASLGQSSDFDGLCDFDRQYLVAV
jgi:predicted esterase